jgi:hypothetical protein
MNYEKYIKTYGHKIIGKACAELELKKLHCVNTEFERLCKKYLKKEKE